MKAVLCRTKDGSYLRSASREAAPEGSEVVEVARLKLGGLQAAITALSGQRMAEVEASSRQRAWGAGASPAALAELEVAE